ncbi:hypothetical protein G6F32_017206 [Rhizopus arrhizus]|nr:hypothetical protein G6F32_017206 [Rhizopus arrhizus]
MRLIFSVPFSFARNVPPSGTSVALASSSDLHSLRKGGPAEAPSEVVMDKKIGAENHGGFAGGKVMPYTGAA